MTTEKNVVYLMQRDALYAYLEMLNAIKEVPRKEVYEIILKIEDGKSLDKVTSFIELEHSKYEKLMKERKEVKEKSLITRIIKFFKK